MRLEQLAFRFLDTTAVLTSDSADFLAQFGRMYRRFQIPTPLSADIDFQLLTAPDNDYGQAVLVLNGDVWPLALPDLVRDGVAFEMVLATIMRHVQSHLLVHAGVVAKDGQALLISADSFYGKTTLVLQLLQHGYTFLSDDIAALNRSTRQVDPFPRSLRIRPGTLARLGYGPEAAAEGVEWRNKLLLDVEQLRPHCIGRSAPIGHIILLHADTPDAQPQNDDYHIHVVVDRADPDFMAAMQATPGLLSLTVAEQGGHPRLTLHVVGKADAVAHLYHWSQACRVLIIEMATELPSQPDFDRAPRLEKISKQATITHLLHQFKGSHQSRLLDEAYGGNATRLYLELAGLVKQAQCWRLTVGRLDEMTTLLLNLPG